MGLWWSRNRCARIGPYVVTKSEIPDPGNLGMEVRVNEQVRRRDNSVKMIFNTFEIRD